MAPRRKFADTSGRNKAAKEREQANYIPWYDREATPGDAGNYFLEKLGINLAIDGVTAAVSGIRDSYTKDDPRPLNTGVYEGVGGALGLAAGRSAAAYALDPNGKPMPLTPQMQSMLQFAKTGRSTGTPGSQATGGGPLSNIVYGTPQAEVPSTFPRMNQIPGVGRALPLDAIARPGAEVPTTWQEALSKRTGEPLDAILARTFENKNGTTGLRPEELPELGPDSAASARSDQAVEDANVRGSYLTPYGDADTGKASRRPISELETNSRKAIKALLGDRERLTEVGKELAEITATTSLPRFLEELKRRDNSPKFVAAHENRLNLKAALEREQAKLQGTISTGAAQADALLEEFGLLGQGLDTVMQLSDSEVEAAIAYAIGIDEGRITDPRPITEFEGPVGAVVNAGNGVLDREGVNGVAGSMFEEFDDGTWDADYSQFNGSQDYIDWFVTKFDAVEFQMPTGVALEDGTAEMRWVTFDQAFNDISTTDDKAIQDNMTNMLAGAMLSEMEEDIVNQSAEIWESGAGKWNDILSSIYQSLAAAQNGGGTDGATLDARAAQREELQGNYNNVVESL